MVSDDGFLSRWSSRKLKAKTGSPLPAEAQPESTTHAAPSMASPLVNTPVQAKSAPTPASPTEDVQGQKAAPTPPETQPSPGPTTQPPLPTMDDVRALTKDSDYSRFVQPGVDPTVKNAAFKQLFSDPFFNEMDGLDIYIDDYSQPNPLPLSLARKLTSAKVLNLFETPEEKAARKAAEAAKERTSNASTGAASHAVESPAAAQASDPLQAEAQQAETEQAESDQDTNDNIPSSSPNLSATEPTSQPPIDEVPWAPQKRPVP